MAVEVKTAVLVFKNSNRTYVARRPNYLSGTSTKLFIRITDVACRDVILLSVRLRTCHTFERSIRVLCMIPVHVHKTRYIEPIGKSHTVPVSGTSTTGGWNRFYSFQKRIIL